MANYGIVFELRSGEANYGKIVVTNENPFATGQEEVFIQITSPDGELIKEFDFDNADLVLDGGPTEYTIDIPETSDDDWMAGTYLVEISEQQAGDPGVYTNETYEFYWSALELTAAIGFSANCVCGKLTVTDETAYGTSTIIERTMKIIPPYIAGQDAPTPTESSTATTIISFGYANVKYQTILQVSVERVIIDGVTSNEEFTKTQWNDVVCDYDFCGLLACVRTEYTRIQNLATQKGGIKHIAAHELDVWLKLNRDFQLHNAYITCGDYAAAQALYETIKDDLNCQCGCGSASSGEPVAISPACGEEGADPLTLDSVYPVIVELDGSTWTISLDEDWLATVDALRGHVIVSDSDFITVDNNYDGGTNITTWTLNTEAGEWNYLVLEDFSADFQDGAGNVGAYRRELATDNIVVVAKFTSENEVLLDGTTYEMWSTPLGADYQPAVDSAFFPVLTDEGTVVGYVQLMTDGRVLFRPSVDYFTDGLMLHFQIVWNANITMGL